MWKTQELEPDSPMVIIGVRNGPICYAFSIAAKIKTHGKCEVIVRKATLPDRNGSMRSVEQHFNLIQQLLKDSFGCRFEEKKSDNGEITYNAVWD